MNTAYLNKRLILAVCCPIASIFALVVGSWLANVLTAAVVVKFLFLMTIIYWVVAKAFLKKPNVSLSEYRIWNRFFFVIMPASLLVISYAYSLKLEDELDRSMGIILILLIIMLIFLLLVLTLPSKLEYENYALHIFANYLLAMKLIFVSVLLIHEPAFIMTALFMLLMSPLIFGNED